VEEDILAFGLVKEIAAVGTEDERADGSHWQDVKDITRDT
jgi:hypothetical protein